MRRQINGILLLDKPLHLSSNGALQRVKRLFNAKKAGHTGSLDPLATGMLPLCFGEATKFSQFLLESNKRYAVIAKLGVQTTTGDTEGEVVATLPVPLLDETKLNAVLANFVGEIEQVPPMFSALKVQGKPLYELARKGIEVERKSRRITIFSLTLEKYDAEQNEVHLEVHCSKGTYVRTLVEDIGHKLGCGAHVKQLRRTIVTPYDNAKMYTLPELEDILAASGYEGLNHCLLPIETSVETYPIVQLSTSAAFYLKTGQAVRTTLPTDSTLVRLVSEETGFLGMGEVLPDGRVKPHRLVSQQA